MLDFVSAAHDRPTAFTAFDAALAISPSSALTYICGSVVLSWGGEAERAIEWGERGLRLSPFDPWAFAAFGSVMLGHFRRSRYEEAAAAAYKPSKLIQRTASTMCFWQRLSLRLVESKKPRLQLHVLWNCTPDFVTRDNFLA